MNKVSFKKSMDKMAINEPDYGEFGVFFKLEKEFWSKKKRATYLKKVMNFFSFNINFILQSLSASVNYTY